MTSLDALYDRLRAGAPALELRRDEPMSRHTTFRVGGPAALMALPTTEDEIKYVLETAESMGIAPFFLGNGSNLLVDDKGCGSFVVKTTGLNSVTFQGCAVTAQAGVTLAQLAAAAAGRGLSGLEFAHGIPGTLGGGLCMNAGAYGGEMRDVVEWVEALEEGGGYGKYSLEMCKFAYRNSLFLRKKGAILRAKLALKPDRPEDIRGRMEELARRRREKQPLEYPSAGSTFKRPEGHFAAALIEQCGLKGLRVGGAQVSEKHAGFIVNTGGATCADILALMDRVREEVLRRTGVALEPEVRYLK